MPLLLGLILFFFFLRVFKILVPHFYAYYVQCLNAAVLMHFTFIFWLSTLFSYLINLNHGLKNLFLWIIFRWYIRYRTTSKGYWAPIIEREEYRKKISGKSQEYQRYIGLEPINWLKNRALSDVRSNRGSLSKYRRYIANKYINEYIWYINEYIGYIADIWL